MKTISLRELHNNTGKWVRSAKNGEDITVTDRGVAIAVMSTVKKPATKKFSWTDRPLVPGYAKYLREGRMGTDSTPGISADRTSRDNSVAGIVD
jgi:prevent-host-death family protein